MFLSEVQFLHTSLTLLSRCLFKPTVSKFNYVCCCIFNMHDTIGPMPYNFLIHGLKIVVSVYSKKMKSLCIQFWTNDNCQHTPTLRGGNRPGQDKLWKAWAWPTKKFTSLSLAYEKIYKPESGLWPITCRFSWLGLFKSMDWLESLLNIKVIK